MIDRRSDSGHYPPISDYGVIGDCRTAALISRRGSIDWLCLPRFDAPSLFNSLLDLWRGGRFAITPRGPFLSSRRYIEGTNVLVTEFRTSSGRARLTDLMPALGEEEKRRRWLPDWSLLRRLEVLEGEMVFDVLFKPRPGDGEMIPAVRRAGPGGFRCEFSGSLLYLGTNAVLEASGGEATGRFALKAADSRLFWLCHTEGAPASLPPLSAAGDIIEETVAYWRRWVSRCRYSGPYRCEVVRSALTLKLLSYAPSGAIVAAPTTSLPEALGFGRNWDYRFCWLRDASYTAQAFLRLGFHAEASSFVEWMMYATARTHPTLKVFYDLHGEHSRPESSIESLEGYAHCRPARRGNGAESQYQLDVYGEVMQALALYVQSGCAVDSDLKRLIMDIGDYVASHWTFPDHGIWEMRRERRHYVHSKAMCWVALRRAESLARGLRLKADYGRWHGARAEIEQAIARAGYCRAKRAFAQSFGAEALDVTSLALPVIGLLDPRDPRASSTLAAVRRELECGDGLLYRYLVDDGLPGREGAFLAGGFLLAEALAVLGRGEEAVSVFEAAQRRRNDLGLFAEEVEPKSGALLGNFPLALSHLAHVLCALMLSEGRGRYDVQTVSGAKTSWFSPAAVTARRERQE